ncbi:site-specific integrase [Alsobacter sp. KACC 23698]|uniref:Site-specific integrase n=1 Tax=Alsobacter sp. KACC 23698 TaxID=3149229 RepID=A0AAU7JNH7_9HYPH
MKVLKEAALTTRNARSKLPSGSHWRSIDPDTHLGYRKGVRGGRWLVRWYKGSGSYAQATLATADDAFEADGSDIIDFNQAVSRARAHVEKARADERAEAAGPLATVTSAIHAYLEMREARERANAGSGGLKRDARSRLQRYVLGTDLAKQPLHRIDETALRQWRKQIPDDLAPASVRRLVNDLKAALNAAALTHRVRLPADLAGTIRAGLKADEIVQAEPRRQVLSDADVRRMITAAWEADQAGAHDGDVARLILVLAATGARFSQVARMTVADVQPAESRLMVPTSRKGRGPKRTDRIGVRVGDDVIEALRPAISGRKGPEPLLLRWRSVQTASGLWHRDNRGPWRAASELSRMWAPIVKAAGLPSDTVPYALRHSSIVRGLRAGLPVRLVAALHDTSSAMVERHYAAFVVDALDELAAKAVVPLTRSPARVISLERKA